MALTCNNINERGKIFQRGRSQPEAPRSLFFNATRSSRPRHVDEHVLVTVVVKAIEAPCIGSDMLPPAPVILGGVSVQGPEPLLLFLAPHIGSAGLQKAMLAFDAMPPLVVEIACTTSRVK